MTEPIEIQCPNCQAIPFERCRENSFGLYLHTYHNDRIAEAKAVDKHRGALQTACAFAQVFLDSADRELRGSDPAWRKESAIQLAAALRNLEPSVYNPDINRSSLEPYPADWRPDERFMR